MTPETTAESLQTEENQRLHQKRKEEKFIDPLKDIRLRLDRYITRGPDYVSILTGRQAAEELEKLGFGLPEDLGIDDPEVVLAALDKLIEYLKYPKLVVKTVSETQENVTGAVHK